LERTEVLLSPCSSNDTFPLTPALSPRRGSLFDRLSDSLNSNSVCDCQTVLPLPWGEGRGEGETDVQLACSFGGQMGWHRSSSARAHSPEFKSYAVGGSQTLHFSGGAL
jgi:hypothetical protein